MAGEEVSMFPKVDNDGFGGKRRRNVRVATDAIRGTLNGGPMEN